MLSFNLFYASSESTQKFFLVVYYQLLILQHGRGLESSQTAIPKSRTESDQNCNEGGEAFFPKVLSDNFTCVAQHYKHVSVPYLTQNFIMQNNFI